MKKLTAFFCSLLLALPLLARSGELDDYYLREFAADKSPAFAAAILSAGPADSAARCGMPIRRGLKKDWAALATATQVVLEKYTAAPTLSGEATILSNGGHFRIHYATSGTDAPPPAVGEVEGIPDWVVTTASVFEAVYHRQVDEMGYLPPPSSPYDVYLDALESRSEYGYTQSSSPSGSVSATSYIVIDNNFLDSVYHPYNGLQGLQIAAAHEFNHAIQYGYNYYFDLWYAEAAATWIEDETFDSVNQLYSYAKPYIQSTTPQNVDAAVNVDTGGGYGRWPLNRYLAENFTNTIIRNVWETLATKHSSGPDIPMLPIIDEVLAAHASTSSLGSNFLGFSRRLYTREWKSHTGEISLMPELLFSVGNNIFTVTNTFSIPDHLTSLPTYSFKYFQLRPATGAPADLQITYPGRPAGNVAIAFSETSGTVTEHVIDTSTNTISVPSFGTGTTVYLLVCNNSSGTTALPTEPASVITSPPDAENPYSGSPTLETSSGGTDPPPSATTGGGGGGGGGCFIATAAYGSYLHPKVQLLREFRDRYLLTNAPGRAFVALYYRLSPPVADVIARHDGLRATVRILLTPLVFTVEHLKTVGAGLILSAGVVAGAVVRRRRSGRTAY